VLAKACRSIRKAPRPAFVVGREATGWRHRTSARYEQLALAQTATFENYAEVASLYFHLSWAKTNRYAQPVFHPTWCVP